MTKKMKRFIRITGIVDTGLITSKVITGGISITGFAIGVGSPVGFALGGTSLLLSLATAITWKSFKIFTVKQEKHDAIKLLAQSKLDSITNIISQAMQDGDISRTEFQKVLQEVKIYPKLKADLKNQGKAKVIEVTKNSGKRYLNKEEKRVKKIFYKKLQTLQVSRVSMPFKIWSTFTLQHVIWWSIKDYKNCF